LGIKGVIQGDLLYIQKDLKFVKVDDEEYIMFQPNTIAYLIPSKSSLAKKIRSSTIGVVWHTVYRGNSFESMHGVFGQKIVPTLKSSRRVWMVDALYRDISGSATMTSKETEEFRSILSQIGSTFRTINVSLMNRFSKDDKINSLVNIFLNSKVRSGTTINPDNFADDLLEFIRVRYNTKVNELKTQSAIDKVNTEKKELSRLFVDYKKEDFLVIARLVKLIEHAKLILIRKLGSNSPLKTMVRSKQGFIPSSQEGYVAIDRISQNAVKLVDRIEFSHNNFSDHIIKGWQR